MNTTRERLGAFTSTHGAFDNHQYHLGDGVWTLDSLGLDPATLERLNLHTSHARLTLQVVASVENWRRKPWTALRVLDLGSAEGMHAVECALRGATVLGIEGRAENTAKAQFAADVLQLANVNFVTCDVRDLRPTDYQPFDVILCLGLLYHLEFPAIVGLLETLRALVTPDGLLLVDTLHAGVHGAERFEQGGRAYRGYQYREHVAGASAEAMRAGTSFRARGSMLGGGRYAAIGTEWACILDKASWAALLDAVGFGYVSEIWTPSWHYGQRSRRVTFAAQPGVHSAVQAAPGLDVNRETPALARTDYPVPMLLGPRPGFLLRSALRAVVGQWADRVRRVVARVFADYDARGRRR